MKRTLAALASTLLTACPVYDAEGKLVGSIPDAEIAQLSLIQEYVQAASGKTSRPKPTVDQLCSLRPATALKPKEGSDQEGEEIDLDEATPRGWVLAVIACQRPTSASSG
jgi:hypothetical protein